MNYLTLQTNPVFLLGIIVKHHASLGQTSSLKSLFLIIVVQLIFKDSALYSSPQRREKKTTHQVGKLNLKCISLFFCTEIAVMSHRVDVLMPFLSP